MRVDVAGAQLELLPQRALWWPKTGTLFVADVHLGKAETFQRHGIPVPSEQSGEELERLRKLTKERSARRLVILGDLFHSAEVLEPSTRERIARFREAVGSVELLLVRGNHDRHVPVLPREWRIDTVSEPHELGPFALRHHPESDLRYVLAGHLHPRFIARGSGDALSLPCFHFGPSIGLLPAFTTFSNGLRVNELEGESYVIVDGDVAAV